MLTLERISYLRLLIMVIPIQVSLIYHIDFTLRVRCKIKVIVEDTLKEEEEQLAFNKAKNISGWVADSTGINTGGWGLTLSPTDMAKIGQLYLGGGMWNGKQIVSTRWIDESTKEHSRWEKLNLPYGYLWWAGNDKEHDYAAIKEPDVKTQSQ